MSKTTGSISNKTIVHPTLLESFFGSEEFLSSNTDSNCLKCFTESISIGKIKGLISLINKIKRVAHGDNNKIMPSPVSPARFWKNGSLIDIERIGTSKYTKAKGEIKSTK